MQSEKRAIKRGNAVRYNDGFQIKVIRKKKGLINKLGNLLLKIKLIYN